MSADEKKSVEILVGLDEIIDIGGDLFFEGFLDMLIAKAYGEYALAHEIDYEVVGLTDCYTLKLKVSAFLDDDDDELGGVE